MRIPLLLAIIFFFALPSRARELNIDSLKAAVATAAEDSVKVENYNRISVYYLSIAPSEALRYARLALELAERINYKRGNAYAWKNAGLSFYLQGKYLETLDYWEQSMLIFKAIDDKKGAANILSNMGGLFFNKG